MKTITLTASETKTVLAALQARKNKMMRERNYLGVTMTQRKRLTKIAQDAEKLTRKISSK